MISQSIQKQIETTSHNQSRNHEYQYSTCISSHPLSWNEELMQPTTSSLNVNEHMRMERKWLLVEAGSLQIMGDRITAVLFVDLAGSFKMWIFHVRFYVVF
jgi:acetyl-CoA carboxylase beta subunit